MRRYYDRSAAVLLFSAATSQCVTPRNFITDLISRSFRSLARFYTFNIGWRVLFEYECRTLPLIIIFLLPLVSVLLCS
jgi:hypothetical protein